MVSVLGTILSFGIVFFMVTFVHEFGHFAMAKLFGVRVDAFSFGIGPRLFGVKNGKFSFFKADKEEPGTDYKVSLVPVICYVKLLGEAQFEKDRPIAPDDLMAKTRGQRLLIMAMGSVMNLVLALVLVAAINIVGTEVPEYLGERPVIGWIESGSPAERAGLRVGDEIVRIGGREVATWSDVHTAVGSKPDRLVRLDVLRDGAALQVDLLTESVTRYDMGYAGFQARILTQVKMVLPNMPAEKAGLRPGDIITAIDGAPVFFYQFLEIVQKSADRELLFAVERGGQALSLRVTPRREGTVGRIGISQAPQSVLKRYGLLAAFGQSGRENASNAFLIVRFIRGLFTGETPASQLGGPLAIADFSYAALRMGWMTLLGWIALLSLQLGIINLIFPIPVVDGPQIVVLTLEAVFRRDVSPKFRIVYTYIGWAMMMALMAFVILNDLVKKLLPNGWDSVNPF